MSSAANSPPFSPSGSRPRRPGAQPASGAGTNNPLTTLAHKARAWLAAPAPGGVNRGVWAIIVTATALVVAVTAVADKKRRDEEAPATHFKGARKDAAATARETGRGAKAAADLWAAKMKKKLF